MELMRHRIPSRKEIVPVFAVALFMTYTWTMYVSFWSIPSWIMFLNIGSIFSIYAYAFVVNFTESILLLLAALIPSLVFPAAWWRKSFTPKGIVLVIVIWLSAQVHVHIYSTPDVQYKLLGTQLIWWIVTVLIALLLSWAVGRITWLTNLLVDVADRFEPFLYFYLSLTAVSVVVILIRINL